MSSSRFHRDRPNLSAIFQKLEKQLPQVTALNLQYFSPELLDVRNPDLAVSGTYQSHEDLHQDERAMQLFRLVNTLLSVDTNSLKRQ
ncbi:hypothetical protein DFH09DRAFT_1315748 [Mycena vulgaris]|nr:hypothetical protein DFH09DRAFT_1315748 [Mycena vulgaris]